MYVIDSSVWVALFLSLDTNHEKAVSIFEEMGNEKIFLPYCVINEVATVLVYKGWKAVSNNFLSFIKGNEDIFIENDNIFPEIYFFESLDSKISFTDSAVIHIACEHGLNLITFDKQMARLFKKQ